MAGSLLKAGFPLTVWNRSSERAEIFAKQGAHAAATAREVAERSEIINSMVADDEASRSVWMDAADGALSGCRANSVLIEASTLSPAWVRQLATAAEERRCAFLDAPVTGSKPQAANGELKFLVGGERQALETAMPVLEAMSSSVIHLGPVGSGALMKLINNFLCGAQAAAFAEALAVIEKSDLDPELAVAILTNGAPGSPLVKTVAQRMTARDYTVNFALDLMLKDLSYAVTEAERNGISLATGAAARDLFAAAARAGKAKDDLAAIVEIFRQENSTRQVSN